MCYVALFLSYCQTNKFINMSDLQEKTNKEYPMYDIPTSVSKTDEYNGNEIQFIKRSAFQNGYELCKKEYKEKISWIPVEEKLPENGDEIELRNPEWINEFNPKGIRTGYYDKCKNPVFYSCFWNTDEECYDTSTEKPTHWRSFL